MRTLAAACIAIALLGGCDLTTRIAANETAAVLQRATRSLEEHWDVDLVGEGLPASILQLEGIYAVIPEDEAMGMEVMRAYGSYAWGWVEEGAEDALARGDLEQQEAMSLRARLLYLRGRNIGLHHMRRRDAGLDAAIAAGPEAFATYLREHYGARDQAAILFWTAYAWGGAIQASNADPELVADLPFVRALLERSTALDPDFFHASAIMALGAMDAAIPSELGGDPERGRAHFEDALARTERRFFAVQLQYALSYAVSVGDRNLFITLLREIVDGGDPDPHVRLANRLARRKAIRLLRRIDELFPQ
ncbi:MAG: TRAP transporter TatT component family protein [Sandaracinaceae bacterium]|nr:TRAP transporter TatT component family protein [Sandaracinaceae bacterium]